MSSYQKQIIKDTTTETVVKFTGIIDAGGQPFTDPANTTLVLGSLVGAKNTSGGLISVYGGPYRNVYASKARAVQWTVGSTAANACMQLMWRGSTSNSVLFNLTNGPGEFDFELSAAAIPSDAVGTASANCGEIFLAANGISFGSYSILLTIRKDPNDFDVRAYQTDKYYSSNP